MSFASEDAGVETFYDSLNVRWNAKSGLLREMQISEADMRRFSEATLHLYAPGMTAENYASRACAFLSELVDNAFVVLGSLDRENSQLDLYVNRQLPRFDEAMFAFSQRMADYRFFSWDPDVSEGKPYFLSDYMSKREFRSSGMYSDVYRALGIDNHCAVLIPDTSESIDFFGIERNGGVDFTETDRALLRMAQDHLKNARALVRANRDLSSVDVRPGALQRKGLTSREADVLYWIAEGKSNEEIAILLGLSLLTVKGYIKTIFRKIGVPNRLSAALWALRTSYADQQSSGFSDPLQRVRVPVDIRAN